MFSPRLIEKVSVSGSLEKPNEDHLIIGDELFVLLDGATGLGRHLIKKYSSDALWFVKNLEFFLLDSWSDSHDFQSSLTDALDLLTKEFLQITYGVEVFDYEHPSAGMVALVVEEGVLNLYRIGDCSVYFSKDMISNNVFGRSDLEDFDYLSIKAMTRHLWGENKWPKARDSVLDLLRSNRSRMNKPGGYGALSISCDCLRYIEKKNISVDFNSKLLLSTDGFSSIVDRYKAFDISGLFQKINDDGLKSVVSIIREIEDADGSLQEYPRLKMHDDASAILINFE